MGDEIGQHQFEQRDFERFDQRLRAETAWVKSLFDQKSFDNRQRKLGYELELCLLDEHGRPSKRNIDVIDRCANPLFTTELAKFNLEINGNPFAVNADVIKQIDTDLTDLFDQSCQSAREFGNELGLFGVLPNLRTEHLDSQRYMTELHRYRQLSKQLMSMRGNAVKLHLEGEEQLIVEKNDVMLEAMSTSLQVHLQLPFDEIVDGYNAALWASMLILGATANSPLVLGKSCWQESRISIFKQAVDTRNPDEIKNHIIPRVHLGKGYIESLYELFDDNLYYSPVLPEVVDTPLEALHHFLLHNGTIWRWVRPILGIEKNGSYHLRLELRVVPSGPTIIDTIANLVFYVGLTEGLKLKGEALTQQPFATLDADFYRAAREGLNAEVHWIDGSSHRLKNLLLEQAMACAANGLENIGIKHFESWLDIIRSRVECEQTGANWILRHWHRHHDSDHLVRDYLAQAKQNIPVHLWKTN